MIAASGPAAMFVLTTPSICLMAVTVITPTFPGPRGIRRGGGHAGRSRLPERPLSGDAGHPLDDDAFQVVLDGGETVGDVGLGEVGVEIGFAPPESHEIEDGGIVVDRMQPVVEATLLLTGGHHHGHEGFANGRLRSGHDPYLGDGGENFGHEGNCTGRLCYERCGADIGPGDGPVGNGLRFSFRRSGSSA